MIKTFAEMIKEEVSSWPGVTAQRHRFGGIEFLVRDREIGHVHGSYQADLLFPNRIRKELVAAGRASVHHILPETGWITYYIRGAEDVPALIELFRMNYDRLMAPRTQNTKVSVGRRTSV